MIQFDLLKLSDAPEIEDKNNLKKDLELEKIIEIIAQKDDLVEKVWEHVLLLSKADINSIKYRQEAVKDAIQNRDTVLNMYKFTGEVIDRTIRAAFIVTYDNPELIVYDTANGIKVMIDALKDLKDILDRSSFLSEAFRELISSIKENIDDNFIVSAKELMGFLDIRSGTEFSVRLSMYNTLSDPVFLIHEKERSLMKRIISRKNDYVFRLEPRDEVGAEILGKINEWVLSGLAPTMLEAYEHLLQFFTTLHTQLAFFVGAINLYDFFKKIELPLAYPDFSEGTISFRDLYCLSLAISKNEKPVPNSLDVHNINAFIISGINKGGKTTFLKAIGQAILLARAGLFVPANNFIIPSSGNVFTHFQREEERTLSYGKFEEEIIRFRKIIESLKAGDYVLMNESFSSTNQVEASVVAKQVVSTLIDSKITVFYVTFLQDFIYDFIKENKNKAVLLTPERLKDGTRTFKLVQGFVQSGYALEIWDKYFMEN